jgi:DNA-binding HxlR family transcriptional regulator
MNASRRRAASRQTLTSASRVPRPGSRVRGSRSGRPIMAALDLLGRRSLLRIVWELRVRALRFRELQAACGEVSPTLLNARLKEMRETQLVELTADGYALTDLGRGLIGALQPLQQWAERWSRSLAR